jgi:hypothetical protein
VYRSSRENVAAVERAVNFCETGGFAHKHSAASPGTMRAPVLARDPSSLADPARLGMENARVS